MDKRLLIIEDDPYIMRALSSILEIEGYALDCVTTGADALSKARSDPPDLFLLDLGLPDMDGLQVIQQLRTQTRRPIIILSARAQENEKVLALDYGAFRTRCEGLNYVIVGGKTAAENAVFTGAKAGRIIRRP